MGDLEIIFADNWQEFNDHHQPVLVLSALTWGFAAAGYMHPTLNVKNVDPSVDPDIIVRDVKQKLDINVALSNSFGFGGHNSCILFKAYKE